MIKSILSKYINDLLRKIKNFPNLIVLLTHLVFLILLLIPGFVS